MTSEDIVNELDERKRKLIKYEKSSEILKMKDEIIWNMLQEKKEIEEKELNIIKNKAKEEISEWSK